jgi:hypothetical protein
MGMARPTFNGILGMGTLKRGLTFFKTALKSTGCSGMVGLSFQWVFLDFDIWRYRWRLC